MIHWSIIQIEFLFAHKHILAGDICRDYFVFDYQETTETNLLGD